MKPARITRALLKSIPLPDHDSDGDKEERGRVLIVGGEVDLPGALILAGIAALRAGAGKLQLATCRTTAPLVGVSVPECLAAGLDESKNGTISDSAADKIVGYARDANATLIGPGLRRSDDNDRLVSKVLNEWTNNSLVLDAGALGALRRDPMALHRLGGNAIITPHAGEMADTLGLNKKEIENDPRSVALNAASMLRCVVALKGSTTLIASPDGEVYLYDSGDIGLATSGSGDTLAGIVAGLLARGTSPLHAAVWGVFLHGAAGNALSKRLGRIGFLARELLDEIPPIMNRL
ncbi:MAG: NAD(P)H-hydrate dehydratase [Gemmatimonadaceae bacterium]